MPSTYQARTLADLPPLICGPMLRKVTSTSVSVFVVTPMPAKATLVIRKAAAGDRAPTPGETEVARSATMQLLQIGNNLHAGLLTCSGPGLLAADTIYGYDVRLAYVEKVQGGTTTQPVEKGLKELELLGSAGQGLGYGKDVLPSFMLPRNVPGLHIFHGSCRKIHAEGVDALSILDARLAATRDNVAERPQQLILTGDQIYADDVSPAVLRMVADLGRALVAPQDSPTDPVSFDSNGVPTLRRPLLKLYGGYLTSEHGDFHLARLGEFYGMYLLAWSDAVWPADLPDKSHLSYDEGDEKEIEELFGSGVHVKAFRATVRAARRALANIATYMMFDDHEVTDDWFFDREWRSTATDASHPQPRRVIRNALLAYSVFQHWGNCPDWHHLQAVPASATPPANENDLVAAAGEAYKPTFSETPLLSALGLSTTPATVLFDCKIDFPSHRLAMIDTRTQRGGLMEHQSSDPLTLNTKIGSFLPAAADTRLTFVVFPPPLLGIPLVEQGQKLAIGAGIYTSADAEFPALNPVFMEDVFQRLADIGPVIVLSGDVHYGFTRVLRHFRRQAGPPESWTTGIAVQLCSSALKNTPTQKYTGLAARLDAFMTHHLKAPGQIAMDMVKAAAKNAVSGSQDTRSFGLRGGLTLKLSDQTNDAARAFLASYTKLAWDGKVAVPEEFLVARPVGDGGLVRGLEVSDAPGGTPRPLAEGDVAWCHEVKHLFPIPTAGISGVVPIFISNNIGEVSFRTDPQNLLVLKHVLRSPEGGEFFYDVKVVVPGAAERPTP